MRAASSNAELRQRLPDRAVVGAFRVAQFPYAPDRNLFGQEPAYRFFEQLLIF